MSACMVCGRPVMGKRKYCLSVCKGKREYQLKQQREAARAALQGVPKRDHETERIDAALRLLDRRRKGQRWAA